MIRPQLPVTDHLLPAGSGGAPSEGSFLNL